jgi:hypothetical protein
MVSVCLATTGFASGNQARPLSALSVYDHQHSTQRIDSHSDQALFTLGVGVFDGECHRIPQRLLSVREADAVLAKVRSCLGWIELEGHA